MENNLGFDGLVEAYEVMADKCLFMFVNAVHDEDEYEMWVLSFRYFGVGLRMEFEYEYLVEDDPLQDVVRFSGYPYLSFAFLSYSAINNFLNALQANRLDKDTMEEFIQYLMDHKEGVD